MNTPGTSGIQPGAQSFRLVSFGGTQIPCRPSALMQTLRTGLVPIISQVNPVKTWTNIAASLRVNILPHEGPDSAKTIDLLTFADQIKSVQKLYPGDRVNQANVAGSIHSLPTISDFLHIAHSNMAALAQLPVRNITNVLSGLLQDRKSWLENIGVTLGNRIKIALKAEKLTSKFEHKSLTKDDTDLVVKLPVLSQLLIAQILCILAQLSKKMSLTKADAKIITDKILETVFPEPEALGLGPKRPEAPGLR